MDKAKKSHTQARGRTRREQLVQAAKDLLDVKPIDEISLADIATQADIPTGSAYHFFSSPIAVFQALTERFGLELDEIIAPPYELTETSGWFDIVDQAVDRGIAFYKVNPGYQQLIIGGKSPSEIKFADRMHDQLLGQNLMDAIDYYFELPKITRAKWVFFYVVQIIDLFFMLSIIRHGEFDDQVIDEGRRAAQAYLREYLPRELPRRLVTRD